MSKPTNVEKMFDVQFTDKEAQVLIDLLDQAVRACGIQAAEAAGVLARRVQEARDADKE